MDSIYTYNDGIFLQREMHHVLSAQVAQNWFVEHSTYSQYVVHPPGSFDLNPTGYLWDKVKRSICTKDSGTCNYQGAIDGYGDNMAEHLRGLQNHS